MKRPIWKNPLAIIFVISLTLNVFVAAALIGRTFFDPRFGAPPPRHSRAMESYLHQAGAESRDRLRAIREQNRAEVARLRAEMNTARNAQRAALAAETFDPQQLDAAMRDARRVRDALATLRDKGFVAFATPLSATQRRELAQKLGRPRRWRRSREKDRN